MDIEEIGRHIVDASVKVHKALGPGLLESAYQTCLTYELLSRKIRVRNEVVQPIKYNTIFIDSGYRADMIVENLIIVENKSVDMLLPIHEAQLLTYLHLGNFRLGFLVNWNVRLIKDGIHRMVNNL